MKTFCQEQEIMFGSQRTETVASINEAISSGKHKNKTLDSQKKMVSTMNGTQVDSLTSLIWRFAKEHHRSILSVALKLADLLGFERTAEFLCVVEFVVDYVQQVSSEMEAKYQEDLQNAYSSQGDLFNRQQFDHEYCIKGNRTQHFITIVLTNYNTVEALLYLKAAYERIFASEANVSNSGGNAEGVLNSRGNAEDVLNSGGNAEDVSNSGGNADVSKSGGNAEDVLNSGGNADVSKSGGNAEDVLNSGGNAEDVSNSGCNAEYVSNSGGNVDVSKSGGNAEDVLNSGGNAEVEFVTENAGMGPSVGSNFDSEDTGKETGGNTQSLYKKHRDFEKYGGLSDNEVYEIAQEVTGLYLYEGNANLFRDGTFASVCVTDPHIEQITVIVESDICTDTVTAGIIF
jgi:sarcosine oxidase gamma subunit